MDEEQMKLAEELLFGQQHALGFIKRLYFGEFASEGILPYPTVDPIEKERTDQLVAKLRSFATEKIDAAAIDRQAAIPESVIRELGEMGVLGMTIPSVYGGSGYSQYAYCRATETLAEYCGSTALFVNAHQSVGLKALLLFGTEEQKKRWLPPLAQGKQIAAFSLTEPNAGSDASGIETTATWDAAANVWRINGRKQWTTNGCMASVLTVMAQTPIETPEGIKKRVTAFLVTPDMPGFEVTTKSLEKVGMRGTCTSNLAFHNVPVPPENILGPIGKGLRVCLTVLDYGRTTFGATCTGAAKALVQRAVAHATTRMQFNRPLSSFPLVKKKIALMTALLYAMEASTYLTAGLIDQGREDVMLESAILKVFTSESLWQILYDVMQILGGRSFFTDQPYERMMRDARLNMIGEGSNEVLRAFIGAVGLRDVGLFFQSSLEAFKHPIKNRRLIGGTAKHFWKTLWMPHIPIQSKELAHQTKLLAKAVRNFAWLAPSVLVRYKEGIVERQLVLERLALSAIAIYTMTAVLGRCDQSIRSQVPTLHTLDEEIAVAKAYCTWANRLFEQQSQRIFDPFDERIERLSDQICALSKGKEI